MLGFEDIRNNQTINVYVEKADEALKALGYTAGLYRTLHRR